MISHLSARIRRNKTLPRNNDIGTYEPYCIIRGARDLRNVKTAGRKRVVPESISPIRFMTRHARPSRRVEVKAEKGDKQNGQRKAVEHHVEQDF